MVAKVSNNYRDQIFRELTILLYNLIIGPNKDSFHFLPFVLLCIIAYNNESIDYIVKHIICTCVRMGVVAYVWLCSLCGKPDY